MALAAYFNDLIFISAVFLSIRTVQISGGFVISVDFPTAVPAWPRNLRTFGLTIKTSERNTINGLKAVVCDNLLILWTMLLRLCS